MSFPACFRTRVVLVAFLVIIFELFLGSRLPLFIGADGRETPNRPLDGFEESGYYFPKIFIWHGLRTSPGRYWMAYSSFASGMMFCLFDILLVRVLKGLVNDGHQDEHMRRRTHNLYVIAQAPLMGSTLTYITIVSETLADVTLSYLIGLCSVQVVIDTMRFTLGRNEDGTTVLFSLLAFQGASIFNVVLLDSFPPLNKLNAAYIAACILVHFYIYSAMYMKRHPQKFTDPRGSVLVSGTIASLIQLAFCSAAFWVRSQVRGPSTHYVIANTFFYSTVALSALLYILSCSFPWCVDAHDEEPNADREMRNSHETTR